jgi:hypothetical protein
LLAGAEIQLTGGIMSDLFKVEVEEVNGDKVRLHLWIVHPDQTNFYATLPFILMALWQGLHELGDDAPFGIRYDPENHEDKMRNEAERVLVTAGFDGEKNHPREIDLDGLDDEAWDAYWADEEGLPQCWIRVEFQKGLRPEALKAGTIWKTSAWNL